MRKTQSTTTTHMISPFAQLGYTPDLEKEANIFKAVRSVVPAVGRLAGIGGMKPVTGRVVSSKMLDAVPRAGRAKALQKAVTLGGGTALAGAGLYGSNRMGHASGREEGMNEGLDVGMEEGLAAALANQNQKSYTGGIWDAVRGQSGNSVNIGSAYGDLAEKRRRLITQLMGGNV